MPTYVAFLRAINLGANRKFPQQAIREVVEAAGFTGVETYINTGNVRLDSSMRSREKVEAALEAAFETDRGFAVPTVVLTTRELAQVAADADELGRGLGEGGRHYVSLLKVDPSGAGAGALESAGGPAGRAVVRGRAVHLLVGGSYREATLTNLDVEKALGVATNRNVNVIRTLAQKWGP